MKNRIVILLILISQLALANNYETSESNESEKGYTITLIKKEGKEIAKFCLIDPEKGFNFYSVESDSDFFKKEAKDYFAFSKKKQNSLPTCVILADFSYESKIKKTFNLNYLWNSLGILIFAPPYLKRADFLNPNKKSQRYFMEVKIGEKGYYGILSGDDYFDSNEVKKIIGEVKVMKNIKVNPIAILDFPIKLLSFDGKNTRVIYESHKNHKYYTCFFLTVKPKAVSK